MKRNGIKIAAAILAVVAVCVAVELFVSYPITPDMAALPEHIRTWYNRGYGQGDRAKSSPPVEVFCSTGIGNTEYYLFEIGEEQDLGIVKLEKGLTGKYKILHMSYGGGNFRRGIVEIGKKPYLLFGGRDVTNQIARISVQIEEECYELTVPYEDDHFLLSTELNAPVENSWIDITQIVLYNAAGEDITSRYDLSGSGIQ